MQLTLRHIKYVYYENAYHIYFFNFNHFLQL